MMALLSSASRVDRKSTRLNSSHTVISYAVFCLKKKKASPAGSTAARSRSATARCSTSSAPPPPPARTTAPRRCASAARPRCFFFTDTATTEIYTLSLHDALPIFEVPPAGDLGEGPRRHVGPVHEDRADRKSTRLNSSHTVISYAVFCLKKKT